MQSLNLFVLLIMRLSSKKAFNLERPSTTCSERLKNVHLKYVYQTQETLFDKPDSFGIEHTNEPTLFKTIDIFDFESICVQKESLKDIDTSKWIGKQLPIFPSRFPFPQTLWKNHFFCKPDPHYFDIPLNGALENLTLRKMQYWKIILWYQDKIKDFLGSIMAKPTQRHNRREQVDLDDCDSETCTANQFIAMQKKQLFDLLEHLERCCNVLAIAGFISAK